MVVCCERQGAMRTTSLVLAALLLTVPAARAGEDSLKGTYKVGFVERGAVLDAWLLKLEKKDGKLTGTVEPAKKVPQSTLENLKLDGRTLTFTIKLGTRPFDFEGIVPKDAKEVKAVLGSIRVAGQVTLPARLERTQVKELELEPQPGDAVSFEQAKETVGKG